MLFAKYKMMELPNGKYIVLERHWDGWYYPYYVEFQFIVASAHMFNWSFIKGKEYDEHGSDTMKEAIIKMCKVKNLIQDRKDAEKAMPKPKVAYKWLNESDMLLAMDTIDEE